MQCFCYRFYGNQSVGLSFCLFVDARLLVCHKSRFFHREYPDRIILLRVVANLVVCICITVDDLHAGICGG